MRGCSRSGASVMAVALATRSGASGEIRGHLPGARPAEPLVMSSMISVRDVSLARTCAAVWPR